MPSKNSKKPAAAGGAFSLDDVQDIIKVIEKSSVTHIEWTKGDEKVVLSRGVATAAQAFVAHPAAVAAPVGAPAAPAAKAEAKAEAKSDKPGTVVTSPFVGTFYRAPAPDAAPFTDVGQKVKKGQTLCIVEAMKLMNEIECEIDGTVAEILVQNATPVEFGEPLFRIIPG
ncbi:MAG TPA: acetyl-CoA carboxylase biotin carboxyl carrier protein [Candidatus Polarisedimenticolia bacterium]|nr:acetyl-CoA carboxylase biotin carboxyl carrier protein [Candidatus Polarisedimenticolia bacterium]